MATSLNIPGYDAFQCKKRLEFLNANQIGKGAWTASEDAKILSMVALHGESELFSS